MSPVFVTIRTKNAFGTWYVTNFDKAKNQIGYSKNSDEATIYNCDDATQLLTDFLNIKWYNTHELVMHLDNKERSLKIGDVVR